MPGIVQGINPTTAGAVQGASALSELYTAPVSPHADDDEFESTTLDPSWTESFTVSATAIDPYALFTGANDTRRKIHTDHRNSWYTCQPTASGANLYLHKPISGIGTNVFVWTRLYMTHEYNTSTLVDNDLQIMFAISATDTGAPDNDNYVAIFADVTGTDTVVFTFLEREGGITNSIADTADVRAAGQPIEYLGIQKRGSSYHAWAATASGAWFRIGEVANAATMDRVAFRFFASAGTAPGNRICGMDFYRRVDTDKGPFV